MTGECYIFEISSSSYPFATTMTDILAEMQREQASRHAAIEELISLPQCVEHEYCDEFFSATFAASDTIFVYVYEGLMQGRFRVRINSGHRILNGVADLLAILKALGGEYLS